MNDTNKEKLSRCIMKTKEPNENATERKNTRFCNELSQNNFQ